MTALPPLRADFTLLQRFFDSVLNGTEFLLLSMGLCEALGKRTTALNDFTGEPGLFVTEAVDPGVVAAVGGVITPAPGFVDTVGFVVTPVADEVADVVAEDVGATVGLPTDLAAAAALAA